MTNCGRILLMLLGLRLVAEGSETIFRPEKLAEMDQAIQEAIAEKRCPGGVLWLESRGVSYHKAFGNRAIVPAVEQMTEDTIFDAASLTKVVGCTPAVMWLIEHGKIGLDEPVRTYVPEFSGEGRDKVTVRHLLTHTSGLRPDIETRTDWKGQAEAVRKACAEQLQSAPGEVFRYSDINFFMLGEIVQRVSQMPLQDFVRDKIYTPLGMTDTGYLPPESKLNRIAPTEVVGGKPWRGVVHDPTARHMGGVAGHAGLFFTAADLAKYARMLLGGGTLEGKRVLKAETVQMMTSVQTPPGLSVRRGLGWDIDSGYSGPRGKYFPLGSYGHTGWTGTSIWIDPFSKSFLIFLSNRNHPDETGNVGALRARLGTLAAEAISDFNFVYVPGALAARPEAETRGRQSNIAQRPEPAPTLSGIDVLVREKFAPLKGLRVGLITNHTGHDRDRNPTIDLLKNAPGVELKVLFSPEHGIRGVADEHVGDSVDEQTGLQIFSLYGEHTKPTPEQLKDVDALVFDIQDVGCRFYTYTSTMGLTLEAAGENGKKYFMLDRPNPINGVAIDGPVLTGKTSFVGFHDIPLRYGMTMGELAGMFNAERHSGADLTVIQMENWRRDDWFDQTGLPWTNPSPNMRNLVEAILYPGVGLLERAISVGRGTDTPFEIMGAPYVEETRFARELNAASLPGARFVPIQFTPNYSVHKDKHCHGVYIVLTDREHCNVVDIGLLAAEVLFKLYPADFDPNKMDHLLLNEETLNAIKSGSSLSAIRASWQSGLDDFMKRRSKFLIY